MAGKAGEATNDARWRARRACPARPARPSFRADYVILEVARRVCLGPQTDLPLHRRLQNRIVRRNQIRIRRRAAASGTGRSAERVVNGSDAIDPGMEFRAVDRHLQLMPRGAIEHERLAAIAEPDV